MRIALIGATGLVSSMLVPRLAGHELLLLSRRPSGFAAEERIAPAEAWPSIVAGERVDVGISTLGTTWRKAGSWPAFDKVDRQAVVEFARAARSAGARQFISVSSVGADRDSADTYLAIKGRTDEELSGLGFERVDILRPGLLRGPRGGERRLGERLGIAFSPFVNLFLRGRLNRSTAIDAVTVAEAIAHLAGRSQPGTHVHENREIHRIARQA